MPTIKIQGKEDMAQGVYYVFDPSEPPLGEGGMGKVYAGRRYDPTGASKPVAIKFMFSGLSESVVLRARREASIIIRHPNLVEMYGFIETEDISPSGEIEHHYHVVSELLDGVMLDDLLQGKTTNRKGEVVPLAEKLHNDMKNHPARFAAFIIRNVLSGVMALHDAGYIHRDIDPTNIMITSDGKIKLIDYGIAKQVNKLTTNDRDLTVAGVFMGKPEYAAPELVLGDVKAQGITTDIYAIGIMLFQCIMGYQPFTGSRHEVMHQQLHSKVPMKGIKNKQMREIISKATDKAQAKRYQTAAEFRVDLDKIPKGQEDSSTGFDFSDKKILFGSIALVLIAVLIACIAILRNNGDDDDINLNTPPTPEAYAKAVALLHSPDKDDEGLRQLNDLSRRGSAEASFLLSRLYFKSHILNDYSPDSIKELQSKIGIIYDNRKAHDLLKRAVEQNPECYPALFEIACDYWKADQRTEAVPQRDGEMAENYFNNARVYAERAGDNMYVEKIDEYLDKVKLWKENIKTMNR